jgi:hypothetical protein
VFQLSRLTFSLSLASGPLARARADRWRLAGTDAHYLSVARSRHVTAWLQSS